MITITEVLKKGKVYRIKVNHETLEIEPEVVLKYRIKPLMTYDEKTYQSLLDDQDFHHYRKKGLKKLSRMMTSYEMKTYLNAEACKDRIVKQIIKDFELKGYLNDAIYVKNYIEIKKFSEGPEVITYKLLQKGIQKELIDQGLETLDEKDILTQLIPQKAKSQKKESIRQMTLKLKTYFVRKGFSLDIIDEVMQKHLDWSNVSEQDIILKEFSKIYKQYAKKLEGYELKKKIYEKLYQKGYQKNDIEYALKELDTLQNN